MFGWLTKLLRPKPAHEPKPWRYVGHDYHGIDNEAHVYRVRYDNGLVATVREHRFHHAHDEARLSAFFDGVACTLNDANRVGR